MPFLFSLLTIALMVFALVDIITRRDDQVKNLPKIVWIILVVVLPLLGSILWFTVGREYADAGMQMPRMPRHAPAARPAPTAPRAPARDTRTTEEQIADLEREIEEWRLREEIAKREQERRESEGGRS